MAGFAARFDQLRAERSLQQISDEIFQGHGTRITPQAMHKWLHGGRIGPANARVLADFFEVNIGWLMHGVGQRSGFTLEDALRAMPHEKSREVLDFMSFQLLRAELEPTATQEVQRTIERLRSELSHPSAGGHQP